MKALFIDLDSTLTETRSGRTFPKDSDDWLFKPLIMDSLNQFFTQNPEYTYLLIVSNQGGIENGYVTKEEVDKRFEAVVSYLRKEFKKMGITVAYMYCPDMNSFNRKPNPGMAYTFALLHGLHLGECKMVGDMSDITKDRSDSDYRFAINAGISAYMDVEDFVNTYKYND